MAAATGRFLRARPVAVSLAIVTLLATVASGSALIGPSAAVRAAAGLGPDGLWAHGRVAPLVTSVLVAQGLAELLLVLATLVLVVGTAERVLGHGRTLVAWLATAVAGGLVGTALQEAGLLARGVWTTPPLTLRVFHPETPVLGVLLAATAFSGPLWRRRIRFGVLAALIVLLLYSGQPEDLYHLLGALSGLALGVAFGRRLPRLEVPRTSHQETRALLATVVVIGAVGPLIAVVQPAGYGLLRPLGRLFQDPLPIGDIVLDRCELRFPEALCARAATVAPLQWSGTVALALLPLVVLLVAAVAIERGRRIGAWLAVAVNGLLAALGAVYYGLLPALRDPDRLVQMRGDLTLQSALAVLVPLGVAVAAFVLRRNCPVLPSRRAFKVGVGAVVGVTAALVATDLIVGALAPGQFFPRANVLVLLRTLPERFVPVGFLHGGGGLLPIGPLAALLQGWVGAGSWAAVLAVTVALATRAGSPVTGREQARLRELLRVGSMGSVAWMTTWSGNRTWFSQDGRHAIAYRQGAGVALTLGAPVGDPEGTAAAAHEFALHCGDRGLVPAFYTVDPAFLRGLRETGMAWSSLEVGDDTLIDPEAFTLRGKHWQDIRSSFNRAERAGIRAEWTDWASLPLGQRRQIEAISEEWVADRRLPELGFTLGALPELRDRDVRLMLAVGPEDRVEAFTSWLPTWRDGRPVGLTLDVMRRRAGSMNGVMEFIIASVVGLAREQGLSFVSLSVAPLSGAGGDEPVQRMLGGVARMLEPAYGFASLAAYKEKFKPVHRPQLLVFPDAVALPAISLAIAMAYLPDRSLRALARAIGAIRAESEPSAAPPARDRGAGAVSGRG